MVEGRGSDGDKGWIVLWLDANGGQISQNFHATYHDTIQFSKTYIPINTFDQKQINWKL